MIYFCDLLKNLNDFILSELIQHIHLICAVVSSARNPRRSPGSGLGKVPAQMTGKAAGLPQRPPA